MLSNGGPGAGGFQPLEDGDPRIVGGYRLVARLGSGGMGRVYLSHTPGGRAVAVKVIRPELAENAEFRKRFQAEVAAASRVHGLYTAPVVDSDTEGSIPWCATAYVPGPSLADAIRDHGPLPVDTVLRLIAGVAEALQAVHREGIVHRDLKPSNVLLADDGPRVIDFGVARAADATSVTQSGMALGTVAYMAPEQALGGEAAPSADVFALGQTAVFASTGRGAFGDGDAHAVLYRVVHEQPDLGQVPDEIRELVARCLRKPAAERPSVEEVIRSVQTIQTHRGDEARYTSGAWLPGELAAGIAARAEGAHEAQAKAEAQAQAEATPSAHASGGFGAAGSGGFGPAGSGGGFGPAGSGGFGPAAAYSPTSPSHAAQSHSVPSHSAQPHAAQSHAGQSHAALPGPFVMGNPAAPAAYTPPPWPQPQESAAAQTSTVTTNGAGRGARLWMLSAAAVVLVAGGAAAALLFVPGDDDKDDTGASEVAASQSAPKADKSPSASGSPSGKASKKPKPAKSALPSGPSGPATPTQAPNPAPPAASSEPTAPKAPAPVTYAGIRMTASHDLYLADTPVRPKADTGSSDEDLTYAVYSSGAVLAPGTTSGSSLALLPSGRQGSVEACKAATGYKSYIWIKDLTVGQQMCVISGTGHVGLVTYQGSSGTTYATLDVKVWRDAA
ncbi:serine/threonine-protein kinase [Streptomyces liliifuscus]|uniref:serine/threonine-protein kinase n=1 Tax=Streptomyces liliifuscus TaxID=2797636 RepID=UPI001F1A9750|nr:serine/threonine-protein kinase [Streptomyces liliifuscus]